MGMVVKWWCFEVLRGGLKRKAESKEERNR